MTISVVVCAYNEAHYLSACLYSLLAQTRPPDDIIVINNASTDGTGAVARAVPSVRVLDEPIKGLLVAREAARRAASTDIVAYLDADAGPRCCGSSASRRGLCTSDRWLP